MGSDFCEPSSHFSVRQVGRIFIEAVCHMTARLKAR